MIGTVHLRSLMCPLSAVATATSLAEANLSATVSSIGMLFYATEKNCAACFLISYRLSVVFQGITPKRIHLT
jgi:hypothetical protein